jgi:predicted nucleotidyltransferase
VNLPLPVQSIRAKPEHREILRRVADILREGREGDLKRMIERIEERPLGPFISEQAAIAFLRDRLVTALKPKAVWLFGSRARGTARPNSDIDLLVVLPDGLDPEDYSNHRANWPVAACGLAYDIVPCSVATFERDRRLPGSLVDHAVSEGKPVYLSRDWRAKTAA